MYYLIASNFSEMILKFILNVLRFLQEFYISNFYLSNKFSFPTMLIPFIIIDLSFPYFKLMHPPLSIKNI